MNKIQNVNGFGVLFASVLGAIASYLNIILVPFIVMVIVIVIDYLTGMVKAGMNNELSSRVGIKGIAKKIAYVAIVAVAIVCDYLLSMQLTSLFPNIGTTYIFGLIATIWLIINELISILENVSAMGVPVPNFLIKLIHKLKNNIDEKTEGD